MALDDHWKTSLWKAAEEIMTKGGELKMIVIKRDRERIPEIYVYPDNKIRCKSETLLD